jgi:D-3-phosphoglycerate dehydrogenase
MRVLVYDPDISQAGRHQVNSAGFLLVDELTQLLQEADVISLHLPLTEQTRDMFGAEQFACMRTGSYFINTARGGIVDEQALYEALLEGKLAGAGVDVFQLEPPNRMNPLLALDSVCATPHIALSTSEALARLASGVARDVLRVLAGEKPNHAIVSPTFFPRVAADPGGVVGP